jgi:hypothetical protein
MTSIIDDFDAIRAGMPSADLAGQTHQATLAALR